MIRNLGQAGLLIVVHMWQSWVENHIFHISITIDAFHWAGSSRGQELGSVLSAAVCKIQVSKYYIESLPLVPKAKRSCFSQGESSTVQLPLDCAFTLQK